MPAGLLAALGAIFARQRMAKAEARRVSDLPGYRGIERRVAMGLVGLDPASRMPERRRGEPIK